MKKGRDGEDEGDVRGGRSNQECISVYLCVCMKVSMFVCTGKVDQGVWCGQVGVLWSNVML